MTLFRSSLAAGLRGLRRRRGLVLLIYGLDLALALALAYPLYAVLAATVGPTGFSDDLAAGFDIVLWADIFEEIGPVLGALLWQLLWIVPLYGLWKVASRVGLAHALRGDQIRPFWQGVGRYTGRGVLLALGFVLLIAVVVVAAGAVAFVLLAIFPGEAGQFWTVVAVVPLVLVIGLAWLDLSHDFARLALVVEDRPVQQAIRTGLAWPFRHRAALALYGLWFVPAAVLLVLPTLLDANVAAATGLGIWSLFAVQQIVLLLRAAVTVGWIGSEAALYEAVWMREAPLIAAAPEATPAAWRQQTVGRWRRRIRRYAPPSDLE